MQNLQKDRKKIVTQEEISEELKLIKGSLTDYITPSGEIYKTKQEWDGGNVNLSGQFNRINIFMRGGKIFPYQNNENKFIPNTKALNKEKTELFIIPDSDQHIANGDVIFDNDEYNTIATKNYYYFNINFNDTELKFSIKNEMTDCYKNKDIYISKLKFFRMKYLTSVEKNDMARVEYRNGRIAHLLINYLSDDIFEVDLSKLNIRFFDIDRVTFFENN